MFINNFKPMNETKTQKRKPADYQPPDCNLVTIARYADKHNLSPVRIYQLFQEDKLTIVLVDGKQFVQTLKK